MSRLVLGTRGSALALKQASIVRERLKCQFPDIEIAICVVQTEGDMDKKTPLSSLGGKGIFIKSLERALLDQSIDIAVHSLKDVTTHLEDGLVLGAFLKAESVCDVWSSLRYPTLSTCPEGAIIGTGSMRRKALIKRDYPHLKVMPIRGNVDTRVERVAQGDYDGVLLSEAGLIRLDRVDLISERLDPSLFLPAPGQGVIALETRAQSPELLDYCLAINDDDQSYLSKAQLAFLDILNFDCETPLGLHIVREANHVLMKSFITDGSLEHMVEESVSGSSEAVFDLVKTCAERSLTRLESLPHGR